VGIHRPIVEDKETSFTLAEAEHYKGIFYVRLSALPPDQQSRIYMSFYRHAIINILKDDFLLSDCMSYADYTAWHKKYNLTVNTHIEQAAPANF
jgi:hypothetical protein